MAARTLDAIEPLDRQGVTVVQADRLRLRDANAGPLGECHGCVLDERRVGGGVEGLDADLAEPRAVERALGILDEAANVCRWRNLPAWRAKTAAERSKVLRRWFDLMLAHHAAYGGDFSDTLPPWRWICAAIARK